MSFDMKYIDAERLKAEIEKNTPDRLQILVYRDIILSLIDSLQQEQPTKGYDESYLNKCIAKASKTWENVDVDKYMDEVRGREQEQPDFPTTDEEVEKALSTIPKAELPDKYKGYEEGRRNGFTAGYNKAMKEVEQKDQKPAEVDESTKRLNDNWMKQHFDEYTEQKPAEWDDYTKTNLGRAIQIIKDARGTLHGYQTDDGIYECDKAIEALEHFLYRGLEIEKLAEWSEDIIRKAIKEVGLTQHQIDWFKTNVFPPKPEWSEEDADILNCCISSIEEAKENRYAYKETDGDTSYDREIDWLKSLRPVSKEFLQPHWKPSENQMSMLLAVVNDPNNAGSASCHLSLKSLYNDLKKL